MSALGEPKANLPSEKHRIGALVKELLL